MSKSASGRAQKSSESSVPESKNSRGLSSLRTQRFQVELKGRDRFEVDFRFDDLGKPKSAQLAHVSGCSALEAKLREVIQEINATQDWPSLVRGSDHSSILVRELLMRAMGTFQMPYTEVELCHCRAVPTDTVDRAIVGGCHTIGMVARMTSAGTSCGTCKQDTEKLIAFRLSEIVKATGEV